ncbi:hypothetical protein OGATHE_003188 [Ogataea polymorpha]|uniref:Uncharacterized protein n=1 Tax=Ogataea polymorpha TaxID=460523 RepID=A0A9P8P9G2_9ASCO|nr:hypothetical protein OGATHE_003188 [Ogataea polymorpha]
MTRTSVFQVKAADRTRKEPCANRNNDLDDGGGDGDADGDDGDSGDAYDGTEDGMKRMPLGAAEEEMGAQDAVARVDRGLEDVDPAAEDQEDGRSKSRARSKACP